MSRAPTIIKLEPKTLEAFRAYVRDAEEGMQPTHVSVAAWHRNKATAARLRMRMHQETERLTPKP